MLPELAAFNPEAYRKLVWLLSFEPNCNNRSNRRRPQGIAATRQPCPYVPLFSAQS